MTEAEASRVPDRALWAVTALAAVVRLAGAGMSYSGDDFPLLAYAIEPSLSEMIAYLGSINYAPLHTGLLNVMFPLSSAEAWMRLPGILAGIASVPLLYRFAERAFDRRVALVAAGILAVSPFHLDQALQLKPMTLLGLGSLVSLWGLERWLAERTWKWLAVVVVANALMLYSHYFAAPVIFFQNVAVAWLWVRRTPTVDLRRFATWIGAQVATLVLWSPWMIVLWRQIASGTLTGYTPSLSLVTVLPELALTFTVGYSGISVTEMTLSKDVDAGAVLRRNLPFVLAWLACFVPATVLAFRETWRAGRNGRYLLGFLVCTLFLPLGAGAMPFVDRFSPKLVLPASLGAYVALALVIARGPRVLGRAIGVGVFALSGVSLYHFYFAADEYGRRADYRALVEHVQAEERPDDVMALGNFLVADWYYEGPNETEWFYHALLPEDPAEERQRAADALGSHPRVWFVRETRAAAGSPHAIAFEWLGEHYEETYAERFGTMAVLHRFERTPPADP